MTQSAKAQEPSMEEILASIRRIIADDDGKPAPAPAATTPPAAAPTATQVPGSDITDFPAPEEVEILDLVEPVSETGTEGFRTIEPGQDLMFGDAPSETVVAVEEVVESVEPAAPAGVASEMPPLRSVPSADAVRRQFERETDGENSLLSATATAAVDTAFSQLAQTVLVQNSRTLDDLVREMLRPMLKAWLDDNLPNMVERLVRAEIDRVSRGRG